MSYRLLQGHVLDMLRTLESESVQVCVTSPPYWGLRAYGTEAQAWPDGWRGELGSEPTIQQFVTHLVEIFREVRRVLRKDGVCFVNLGDSYAGSGKGPTGHNGIGDQARRQGFTGEGRKYLVGRDNGTIPQQTGRIVPGGLKPKDLCLIPERFALAMQDDGWYVRSRIAWCKTSAMPESVQDRPTSAWEHIWLMAKSERYFWDAEAVKVPAIHAGVTVKTNGNDGMDEGYDGHRTRDGFRRGITVGPTANLRNFWLLGPEPFPEAHFATFPTEIPRRAILAGSSAHGACSECGAPWRRVVEKEFQPVTDRRPEKLDKASGQKGMDESNGWGGFPRGTTTATTLGWQPTCTHDAPVRPCVILDPFAGSGTTLAVAQELGRDAIGVELNPEYVRMAEKRITGTQPGLGLAL